MQKPTCNDNHYGYFIVLAKLHMYSEKPQIRQFMDIIHQKGGQFLKK